MIMNKLTILFLIIFCCNAIAQPVLPLQVSTTPSCATTCSGMIDLDFAAQGFTVEDLQFQWTCLTNCNCEIVNDQEDLHNVASGTYHLWVHSISGCEGQYDFEVPSLPSP